MDGTPQEFGITGITLCGGGVPPSDFSQAAAPPLAEGATNPNRDWEYPSSQVALRSVYKIHDSKGSRLYPHVKSLILQWWQGRDRTADAGLFRAAWQSI